ncbi:ribonuclease HI family protein [Acaricomes phytoseiuli]|uniref:ribonuclease HI family protein n=2 Tax=Acaricomes phytoseiuli TaxID=291968 RepID=UPI0003A451D4|nr:ribonuclease HI family protein [Acaricomes phytoseiuli]
MTIIAAADGSALGNPGPAGWCWYIDDQNWKAGGWPHGTNNQGELMAVLDLFRATAHRRQEPLRILCDSQYVINCVTVWMPGWKRRGWRKADGSAVLNRDLLQQIDAELPGRDYEFEWVKGHSGHELNEAADQRARAVATAYQAGADPESGPGLAGASEASAVAGPYSGSAPAPQSEPEEADLFSMLEEAEPPPPPSAGAGAEIIALLNDYDREAHGAEASRLATLLAEEFEEVGPSGRIWERDAVLNDADQETGEGRVSLEPLGASLDADRAILLYRVSDRDGSAVQSSHWQRRDGQWRLHFRQTTPQS